MNSALRFPKADGAFIVVTEQFHGSQTYTREVRISVRHIICYYPYERVSGTPSDSTRTPSGATTMQIEGRSQPVRLLHTCEEIDELIRYLDCQDGGLDLIEHRS